MTLNRFIIPPSRWISFSLLIIGMLLATGCITSHRRAYRKETYIGMASWYGKEYHRRFTASGERYNMRNLTAAHPFLPFGTRVKVTHLSNGKSVKVTINDRGPFKGDRIIDLSYKAAQKIGMVKEGLARVKLEILN